MSSPNSSLRIGIAGLGTVGAGLIKIIQKHPEILSRRAGRVVEVVAVSARDLEKDRGVDVSAYAWEKDPVTLARRDDVDVFVEMIGGYEGVAKEAVIAAIDRGKDIVTANKALLAHHGQMLAERAENRGCSLRFEAAVAGGIPVIKTLSEGLSGNVITRIMGVMNGTCNYILTRMQESALPYEIVFEEARKLGYLEADPSLDVDGIDAGHKLALLASIAFGTQPAFDDVYLEGISNISTDDIMLAQKMGYRIKLLGVAQMSGRGLVQRMTPCLVPADSPLGQLQGGTNMVIIEGDSVGQIVLRGPGAGESPTASAVMADIVDIARHNKIPTFGQPAKDLVKSIAAQVAQPVAYYLRMALVDKPGALAKIAAYMGDAGVSIDQMRQINQPGGDDDALVLIVTHRTSYANIQQAVRRCQESDVVIGEPAAIRIEEV